MSEPTNENLPEDLQEMLPVGMISTGGLAAQALARLAARKHHKPDWEAFHYEKITATEFEVTGGTAAFISGAKRWLGPHDSVLVSETELLAELNSQLASPAIAAKPDLSSSRQQISSESQSQQVGQINTSEQDAILKLSLRLPKDPVQREQVLQAFRLQAEFFGAKLIACSLHSEA